MCLVQKKININYLFKYFADKSKENKRLQETFGGNLQTKMFY